MMQGDEHKTLGRYSAWEVSLMALCAWLEARNQGEVGIRAVCWVIRNRVMKPGKTWWGDDFEEVVLKPFQFSCFNKNDPNYGKLPGDPAQDLTWDVALRSAEQAYLGMGIDPTNGATHYYNPKAVLKRPAWVTAPGTVFKIRIGNHYFYKAN